LAQCRAIENKKAKEKEKKKKKKKKTGCEERWLVMQSRVSIMNIVRRVIRDLNRLRTEIIR